MRADIGFVAIGESSNARDSSVGAARVAPIIEAP
jgi:hypothetical protein